jgi:osmotically-inducible protein OsmY
MESEQMVACKILENVKRRLAESPYGFQRRVDAAYDNGILTLSGRVPTFFLKQTAQALVAKVDGVRQVVNLVDVPPAAGTVSSS